MGDLSNSTFSQIHESGNRGIICNTHVYHNPYCLPMSHDSIQDMSRKRLSRFVLPYSHCNGAAQLSIA
jgi:hypothetical protein